jgi:hypothetical protein
MAGIHLEAGGGSQSRAHDLFFFFISALWVGAAFLVVILAGGVTVLRKNTGGRKAVS